MTTPALRHKWHHRDEHNKTCARCGTQAQQRPDPHSRRWFTEWRLPDGSYVNNYAGGKTPPCEPVTSAPEFSATAKTEA